MILARQLMNLLLSELELQDQLLGLLIRERVAIARRSQAQMDEVLKEREEIELKLDQLVTRRQNLFRAVESELRLPSGKLSLDSLSMIEEGELSMLGESLSSAFETIFEMREQNQVLRKQSLEPVTTH